MTKLQAEAGEALSEHEVDSCQLVHTEFPCYTPSDEFKRRGLPIDYSESSSPDLQGFLLGERLC